MVQIVKDIFAMATRSGHAADLYDYKLDGKKDLLDYGVEQQAEILANLDQEASHNKNYQKTVARFKKDPSYIKGKCF